MEPYEDNKTPTGESWYPNADETPKAEADGAEQSGADSGEYSFVRPDAGKSWQDAGYTPQTESTEPPRYYVPADKPRKEKKEKKSGGTSFARVACLCLACALVVGLAGGAMIGGAIKSGSTAAAADAETTTPVLTTSDATTSPKVSTVSSGTMTAGDIYELGCQQVVGIQTTVTANIFGMISSGSVSGSGFILTEDGYIMTNYHVVEDAYQGGFDVTVMLYDGTEYTAEIVGFDDDNDIAVLKIDATGLSAVTLGNSDSLSVGDAVYAIGNPLGELAYSMSDGIVSATDRVISTDESTNINMFQLTAAINSGNSGGPVYDASGEVVGVVTAKYSDTGVEGLGFAIPINDAVDIANDIITNGYVTGKAYMGIVPMDVSASAVQYYNMVAGAYVYSVEEGTAAETAGLKQGDIITEMDGVTISDSSELRAAVKTHGAGDTVDMTVWRSGEYMTVTITFDEEQPETVTENGDGTETASPYSNGTYGDGQIQQYIPGYGYAG